jgi:hypothetical protein
MRADFFRADDPETVVGSADWDGRRAVIRSDDEKVRAVLERVFRATSVVAPYQGPLGPEGETVEEPGHLRWFRAAATARGAAEGLSVRFVTDVAGRWDPALDPETYGWGGRKPALPR